ncbi:MAG TPA: methyltransferase domain-containing protein [Thermodesulfobacteriota bacterium]|nr:methyltransferase domain-containing protein [Thermodesulfobacteriota bacterium]
MEETGKGFWNRLKVEWYRRGLEYSDFGKSVLSIVLPRAENSKTFLDAGSGCGALAIPLAKAGKNVTALDPSPYMIGALKEEAEKLGLNNIKTINASWNDVKLRPHDAIICANVPELLKDNAGFLKEANSLAKKMVFLIAGADPKADKFYYRELFPLIFKKPFVERSNYLKTYTNLHSLGIFANIEIIEYDFDQPFKDMAEALEFWKEYMGIVTEEHDEVLRKFLEKKLKRIKDGLLARFRKKSAVMWWRK